MKRVIKKTKNNLGEKCKTYVYDYDNSIIFYKYTLITGDFENMAGGEVIIKETENYILTFHRFSIKKSTLIDLLITLDINER